MLQGEARAHYPIWTHCVEPTDPERVSHVGGAGRLSGHGSLMFVYRVPSRSQDCNYLLSANTATKIRAICFPYVP